MNAFDLVIVAVVVASTLFAYVRGVIRELIALAAWVIGFVAAVAYAPSLGALLPSFGAPAAVPYIAAFVLILFGALLAGALVAWPLAKVIHAAGLGFVDRFLGAGFGVCRGLLIVVSAVLLAGLTTLPRQDWWQNAALVPPLVAAALHLAQWLPAEWLSKLDYSRDGNTLPREPSPQKV
jgi:membrane protein required for colicin V production